jgi:t-SNARE complex subunit (syntaxin)
MSEQSETPRTDSAVLSAFIDSESDELLRVSKELERELSAARAEIKAVTEQRDRLVKLVNAIEDETYGGIYAVDVDKKNWFDARTEALQSLTTNVKAMASADTQTPPKETTL